MNYLGLKFISPIIFTQQPKLAFSEAALKKDDHNIFWIKILFFKKIETPKKTIRWRCKNYFLFFSIAPIKLDIFSFLPILCHVYKIWVGFFWVSYSGNGQQGFVGANLRLPKDARSFLKALSFDEKRCFLQLFVTVVIREGDANSYFFPGFSRLQPTRCWLFFMSHPDWFKKASLKFKIC